MIANPWSIENNDKVLFSPNGRIKVQYYNLYEVRMGSPLAGEAVIDYDNSQFLIDKMCACPPLWSNSGQYLAIPIWTSGMAQEIAIVNIANLEMKISKTIYRVLHFSAFKGNFLQGTDSPLYNPENFTIDVHQLEYRTIKKLSEKNTGGLIGL